MGDLPDCKSAGLRLQWFESTPAHCLQDQVLTGALKCLDAVLFPFELQNGLR